MHSYLLTCNARITYVIRCVAQSVAVAGRVAERPRSCAVQTHICPAHASAPRHPLRTRATNNQRVTSTAEAHLALLPGAFILSGLLQLSVDSSLSLLHGGRDYLSVDQIHFGPPFTHLRVLGNVGRLQPGLLLAGSWLVVVLFLFLSKFYIRQLFDCLLESHLSQE
jgi:hypothetical protein